MAREKRPLTFITPYSETAGQLKSACMQIAEEENIEVMEVETNQELHQIMANYGPTLMVYTHPKKCAMGLQLNQKLIKKVQAKTVLVTSKVIPRKTLDKFMKLGLTDCITEPISPKSLLYKIKLLIRSLPNLNEQETDYRTVTGEAGTKDTSKDLALQEGLADNKQEEKGVERLTTAEGANETQEGKKKSENKTAADIIETNYKGKIKENATLSDNTPDEDLKSEGPASTIETHYKGTLSEKEKVEDGNMIGEAGVDDLNDNEIEKLKQSFSLDLDDENLSDKSDDVFETKDAEKDQKKKAGLTLEADASTKKNELGKTDVIDKYLKSKNKSFESLDLEDDGPSITQESESNEIAALLAEKKRRKLELEDDNNEDYLLQKKMEKKAKQAEADKFQGLDIEHDSTKNKAPEMGSMSPSKQQLNNKKELEIENDLSGTPKSPKKDPNGQPDDPFSKKTGLQVEQDAHKKALEEANQRRQELLAKKKKQELEIEEDLKQKALEKKAQQPDLMATKKKGLKVESEEDLLARSLTPKELKAKQVMAEMEVPQKKAPKEKEEDTYDANELKKKMLSKKGLKVDQDAEEGHTEDSFNEAEKKQKHNAGLEIDSSDEKAKTLNKSDSLSTNNNTLGAKRRVDYIEKYYNQKKRSETEEESFKREHKRALKEDAPQQQKSVAEKALIIKKEDLGEQTIDYAQIKKEFDALDGSYASSAKTTYKIIDGAAPGTSPTPLHGGHTAAANNAPGSSAPELTPDAGIADTIPATVYYPNSKGIEHAIRALYLYADRETKNTDISTYLAKTLHQKFGARTSFIARNKKAENYTDIFNGHLTFPPNQAQLIDEKSPEKVIALQVTSKELWEKYKLQNIKGWAQTRLPVWSDESFQKENLTYLYPFYEGTELMGLAVIDLEGKFDPTNAAMIEILCETARSLFIYHFYHSEIQGNEGVLGRFKGLLGKKAG